MGAMLTASLRTGLANGESHAVALSAATHGPWLLAVACGVLVAVTGFVTDIGAGTSVGRRGRRGCRARHRPGRLNGCRCHQPSESRS